MHISISRGGTKEQVLEYLRALPDPKTQPVGDAMAKLVEEHVPDGSPSVSVSITGGIQFSAPSG